ncbi:hypothetical protein LV78_005265 [Actinosynnema pretiosum]|nr:hypothetical protein [Actinosynnema pretiosum]
MGSPRTLASTLCCLALALSCHGVAIATPSARQAHTYATWNTLGTHTEGQVKWDREDAAEPGVLTLVKEHDIVALQEAGSLAFVDSRHDGAVRVAALASDFSAASGESRRHPEPVVAGPTGLSSVFPSLREGSALTGRSLGTAAWAGHERSAVVLDVALVWRRAVATATPFRPVGTRRLPRVPRPRLRRSSWRCPADGLRCRCAAGPWCLLRDGFRESKDGVSVAPPSAALLDRDVAAAVQSFESTLHRALVEPGLAGQIRHRRPGVASLIVGGVGDGQQQQQVRTRDLGVLPHPGHHANAHATSPGRRAASGSTVILRHAFRHRHRLDSSTQGTPHGRLHREIESL